METMLTIDELMSMSCDEVTVFLERRKKMINEGKVTKNQPYIDLQNMPDEEIARKYGFTPLETVRARIQKKLNGEQLYGRNGRKE